MRSRGDHGRRGWCESLECVLVTVGLSCLFPLLPLDFVWGQDRQPAIIQTCATTSNTMGARADGRRLVQHGVGSVSGAPVVAAGRSTSWVWRWRWRWRWTCGQSAGSSEKRHGREGRKKCVERGCRKSRSATSRCATAGCRAQWFFWCSCTLLLDLLGLFRHLHAMVGLPLTRAFRHSFNERFFATS